MDLSNELPREDVVQIVAKWRGRLACDARFVHRIASREMFAKDLSANERDLWVSLETDARRALDREDAA